MERKTFSTRTECKEAWTQKDGKAPVYGVITVNGKSTKVLLPIKCKPSEFTKSKKQSGNVVKQICEKFASDIERIHATLTMNEELITAKRLKDIYQNGYVKESYTLNDLLSDFKKQKEHEDIQPHTWNKYENAFKDFMKETGHIESDEVSSVKTSDILLYEAKVRKKSAETTALKALKNVKAFFTHAVSKGKITANPYGTMRIGHGTPDKDTEYLEYNEICKLRNVSVTSDKLERVRTLFLWQCFTGQNYADMTILKAGDVQVDANGNYHINKARYKRGKYGKEHFYNAYLYEDAIDIYKRYGEEGIVDLLIAPSNYNEYLKELKNKAGITKHVTTKSGRKTYACYLYNTLGIHDLTVIQNMMGHENLRQTQEYCKVFEDTVAKTVQETMPTETDIIIRTSKRIN